MAKQKKSRNPRRFSGQPSAKLMRAIGAALEMVEEGEDEAAYQKLLKLVQRHPRSKPTLLAFLELYQEMEEWDTFAYYGENLMQLERGEELAETLNNLVYAYIKLMYPPYPWHTCPRQLIYLPLMGPYQMFPPSFYEIGRILSPAARAVTLPCFGACFTE
jgi:hypothetical protein